MKRIRVADLFCGAGGTSTGIVQACEASSLKADIVAVNHWDRAVETHAANHPGANHHCQNLADLDPRKAVPGGKLDILVASPECVHHSVARGGVPMNDQSRSSAWCILRWATALQVRRILIENVPEFESWGPLGTNRDRLAHRWPRGLKSERSSDPMAIVSPGRAIVITVGESRKESLGAMKLARWLTRTGWTVDEANDVGMFDAYDMYAFSCVFSWNLPRLTQMARHARSTGAEVWIGGPAVTFSAKNAAYVERESGVKPSVGLDERFEREPGEYPMVYFSRGCPAYTPACGLCPVPKIEGNEFRYYPDSTPAPLLLDNNLSALPDDYQDHIIRRYADGWKKRKLVDANSGFEPHTFTAETLKRWEKFPLSCWRFGYDDLTEREEALRMMKLLRDRGHTGEKVRVYTLIGNEPKEACHQRVREVIENGCHPWPQRLRPLDWLGGDLPTRHDWTEPDLIAFQRFYGNAGFWGRLKPEEFFYQGRHPLRGIGSGRPGRFSLEVVNR